MSQYNYYQENIHFSSPRITWGVQRLILLNILIFVFQLVSDPLLAILDMQLGRFASPMPLDSILGTWFGFQPVSLLNALIWKPFTYQFLHGGLMHLFMNMIWLFFFGVDVERVLGTRQFIRFYIICGAAGVLATLVPWALQGANPTVIGASGAIMGIMIAFAMVEPDRQFFLFPIPFPVNARALVVIVIVMNIISALGQTRDSVATHFGGMIVGYLYMKMLPRMNAWQREKKRKKTLKKEAPNNKVGEAVDNIFKFKDRK